MIFKSMYISLVEWGEDKGKYSGTITFADADRKIELVLRADLARRILEVCAGEIRDSSTILANSLLEATNPQKLLASPEAVNDPS